MKQYRKNLSLIIAISVILISCGKDEVQAEKSIEGIWDVVEIRSFYGTFSNNGSNITETVTDAGELGTFSFSENSIDFNFTRNDTTFTGTSLWNLDYEKVNAGFSRVPKFTLDISNHFLFEVLFEDSTKNAEKNATKTTFIETPTDGFGVLIEMSLEKR